MTCHVERDMLLYAALFQPVTERIVRHTTSQTFKNFSCVGLSAKLIRFETDGQCCFGLGFHGSDTDAIASVRGNLEILPFEIQNIADTQSCQTRKERCSF